MTATGNAVPKGFTPWKPGQSGNPKGSPTGSRHRVTKAVEALLNGQAEGLTQKAIRMALAGDMIAMRLCLDRIAPAPRDKAIIDFPLPPIRSAEEAAQATALVLAAVTSGKITTIEAVSLTRVIETYVRATEVSELEARVQRLEGRTVTVIEP
jgi:Family of unknown function (DUF5681)